MRPRKKEGEEEESMPRNASETFSDEQVRNPMDVMFSRFPIGMSDFFSDLIFRS